MGGDAEAWIDEGVDHISGESCPYCLIRLAPSFRRADHCTHWNGSPGDAADSCRSGCRGRQDPSNHSADRRDRGDGCRRSRPTSGKELAASEGLFPFRLLGFVPRQPFLGKSAFSAGWDDLTTDALAKHVRSRRKETPLGLFLPALIREIAHALALVLEGTGGAASY
jgi:hypothetical protein